MNLSSWFSADGHNRFQVLWQDGDRVFCRRVDGERDVLAGLLSAGPPAPAALVPLSHEYWFEKEVGGGLGPPAPGAGGGPGPTQFGVLGSRGRPASPRACG